MLGKQFWQVTWNINILVAVNLFEKPSKTTFELDYYLNTYLKWYIETLNL